MADMTKPKLTEQEAITTLTLLRNDLLLGGHITRHGGNDTAFEMAFAALQASVPHVFTLEELSKKQGELIERETLPAWYESKFEKQFDGWELMFRNSGVGNYGILWRCWSHKPTADQMAATPWTKQEG